MRHDSKDRTSIAAARADCDNQKECTQHVLTVKPRTAAGQKRAHPSSCGARTIVGADDGVVQDLVPDDDALFGAKSADPTSNSDSASTSSVVEEDEPGAKRSRHGLLTSGVRAKATITAMMTEMTTLSRLPTMMNRNPAWIFHLKTSIALIRTA